MTMQAISEVTTWQQGRFIDGPEYQHASAEWKEESRKREALLVRPAPTENAICQAVDPDAAKWIAQRLNLAAKLEQMTYDFATGKTDGSELTEFVRKAVGAI
jgi:hypothetical protein